MSRLLTRHRDIETVPPALIGLLQASGKLPVLPPGVAEFPQIGSRREPTLQEVVALTWLLEWDGAKVDAHGVRAPVGVAAYRDTFDYSSGADVREIVHIAGSKRAVVDLVSFIADSAHRGGRCITGSIDAENHAMLSLVAKMGYQQYRVIWGEP